MVKSVVRFAQVQILRLLLKFFSVKEVKSSKDRKIFTELWHKIWLEEGYARPGDSIVEKYAKYDKFSTDLLVKFLGIIPAGTMRLIKNNDEVGVPTINDFEITKPWKTNRIIEATLLTVPRKFRRRFLFIHLASIPFLALMKALYQHARKEKVEGLVIAADQRLFNSLTKKMRFPCIQIGKEKYYEGSITVPAYIPGEKFEEIFKRNNPLLAQIILD